MPDKGDDFGLSQGLATELAAALRTAGKAGTDLAAFVRDNKGVATEAKPQDKGLIRSATAVKNLAGKLDTRMAKLKNALETNLGDG